MRRIRLPRNPVRRQLQRSPAQPERRQLRCPASLRRQALSKKVMDLSWMDIFIALRRIRQQPPGWLKYCYRPANPQGCSRGGGYLPHSYDAFSGFPSQRPGIGYAAAGASDGSIQSSIASADGFAVRVVFDYDSTHKKDTVSFDVLYGVKTLNSSMTTRLVG